MKDPENKPEITGEILHLTEEGREWAEAHPFNIVAQVALEGYRPGGRHSALVENAIRHANEQGATP